MKTPFKKETNTTQSSQEQADVFFNSNLNGSGKSGGFLGKFKRKKALDIPPNSTSEPLTDNRTPSLDSQGYVYEDDIPVDNSPIGGSSPMKENLQKGDSEEFAKTAYDPYAAPSSDMTDFGNTVEYNYEPWYSTTGRIGRVKLLAYGVIWGIIFAIILLIAMMLMGGATAVMMNMATESTAALGLLPILLLLLSLPVLAFTYVFLPRRRLHDVGKSGWWLLLWLVPLANFYLIYLLYFKAGDIGTNEYGLPDAPNTTIEKVLAVLSVVAILVPFALALMFPAMMATEYTDSMNEEIILEEVGAEPTAEEVVVSMTDEATESVPTSTDDTSLETQMSEPVAEEPASPQDESVEPNVDPATNSVNNNTADDPEVQAAIDAALGNEATNSSNSNSNGGVSYEEFMRMSETKILVDETPNNVPDAANGETTP